MSVKHNLSQDNQVKEGNEIVLERCSFHVTANRALSIPLMEGQATRWGRDFLSDKAERGSGLPGCGGIKELELTLSKELCICMMTKLS